MSKNNAISAKVRAMYGRRLKPADYAVLMECHTVDEVAKTLAQFPCYAATASVLNEGILHRGYLESALRRQYFDEFLRLYHYLAGPDKKIVQSVILRYEITELLFCLQESKSKSGFLNFRNEYIDRYSALDFTALSQAGGHKQLLAALEGTVYASLLAPLLKDGHIRVLDAEDVLYDYYYKKTIHVCQTVLDREHRKDLKQLIGMQMDFANVARIVRLRKYFGREPDRIMPYLFTPGYRLSDELLYRLMEARTEEERRAVLQQTPYGDLLDRAHHPNMGENMDELMERASRRMIHFAENAAALVLAYLKTKDIELRNIVTLIEAKRYELSDAETRVHLIGLYELRKEG